MGLGLRLVIPLAGLGLARSGARHRLLGIDEPTVAMLGGEIAGMESGLPRGLRGPLGGGRCPLRHRRDLLGIDGGSIGLLGGFDRDAGKAIGEIRCASRLAPGLEKVGRRGLRVVHAGRIRYAGEGPGPATEHDSGAGRRLR